MSRLNPHAVTGLPTKLVNAALTIPFWVERNLRLCHGDGMLRRNTQAGGIFLTIGILAGFGWGLASGNPMKGILIGTALGAAAALLLWLLDRRR